MDKQNNGFALIFAHTYTIICPTTVETEMSMWKTNRIARGTYKCFATNQGKSDLDGVTTTYTMYFTGVQSRIKGVKTVYSVPFGKYHEQENDESL